MLREGHLIAFVAGMAALEVVSTAIFLEDLRTDRALLGFAVIGLMLAVAGCGSSTATAAGFSGWSRRRRSVAIVAPDFVSAP